MSGAPNNAAPAAPGKFLKNVLGIIFFIVLIIGGILIAVYGARTIPGLFQNGNGASVYSSSIFHPNTNASTTQATQPTTTTEPTATTGTNTTAQNGGVGGAINSAIQNGFSTPVLPKAPTITEPGTNTTTSTKTGSTGTTRVTTGRYVQVPTQYYGLPDLTVHITEVGYLNSRDQFIESDTVPNNRVGVVHFVVFNGGTSPSGSWRLQGELPTNQDYRSGYQASILPGGSSVGELLFDNADRGNNQDIVIEVDSSNNVAESNERNNEDSTEIDVD